MHATLPHLTPGDFPALRRAALETVQVNLGYLCNQSCLHCHVNAGPQRRELMSGDTVAEVLEYLRRSGAGTLDMTGGAPEMNPHFRRMVEAARALGVKVMDRCNLTILEEPGYEGTAEFLAEHRVEVVASLPCYLEDNVDAQRGKGVFGASIAGLQRLNRLGYGAPDRGLLLNLVYNPQGPSLPPPQGSLQEAYKAHLRDEYGVVFNQLYTLANMPINRFGSTLISKGSFGEYLQLLKDAHQDANLAGVMCRSLVSIDWQGYVYDCDFNQMLGIGLAAGGKPRVHVSELLARNLEGAPIAVADHCYGCTAGQGSSCGGALN